jgi:hypothetical protein
MSAVKGLSDPLYQRQMPNEINREFGGMRIGRGTEYLKSTCPSASLFITNPTLSDLALNPGCHSEKLPANHQSYGMVWHSLLRFIV